MTFLYLSCATKKSFEITSFPNQESFEDFHIIKVNSDQIKQGCAFLDAEDENKWRHQYAMYILNDQKEVIEVLHSIHQAKSVCLSQTQEVSKIIKKSSSVTLCLRGRLKKDLTNTEFQVFDTSDKFPVRYSFLIFDSICNSKSCFSVNEGWERTCPGFTKH